MGRTLSVVDVEEEITEIHWCDPDWNLVRSPTKQRVTIKASGVQEMFEAKEMLLDTVEDAENLIEAIRKTIDLGWYAI